MLLLHLGQFSVKVMFEMHFYKVALSVAVTFLSQETHSYVSACGVDLEVGTGIAVLRVPTRDPRGQRC